MSFLFLGQFFSRSTPSLSIETYQSDHVPPRGLPVRHGLPEERVHEQRRQGRVARVGRPDVVEEGRADDAAALPDPGQRGEVDAPALRVRLGPDDVHPLRVRADLGRVQGGADLADELRLVDRGGGGRRRLRDADLFVKGRRGDALVLEARQEARVERRLDGGRGHGQVRGLLHRPFAGPLHPGLVKDDVDQRARGVLAGLVVLLGEDDGGDLDEEGLELARVPLCEGRCELVV